MLRVMSQPQPSAGIGLIAVLLVVISSLGGQQVLRAQQQQQLFLSLVDQTGASVTDLKPDEVSVLEDAVQRKVLKVELIDWPMKLIVLVDNGPAAQKNLVQLRNGLRGFFEALPDGVEMSLITLNPQPRAVVRPTTERKKLTEGIDLIAPDSAGAKFVEAIVEAGGRIEKDKSDHFPVIMAVGTDGAEGSAIRERDLERLAKQIAENAVTVHVAMLSLGGERTSAVSGAPQVQLGISLTQMTGGKYENIAAATRLATLLPEFGQMIARSHRRQSAQYRIIYERPSGAAAPAQGVSAATSRAGVEGILTFDGHIPQP